MSKAFREWKSYSGESLKDYRKERRLYQEEGRSLLKWFRIIHQENKKKAVEGKGYYLDGYFYEEKKPAGLIHFTYLEDFKPSLVKNYHWN